MSTTTTQKHKGHGLPTMLRSSNTILVAADINDDHMDKVPLPDSVKDNFTEWIDKGFISVVKDQMFCGGCWAFATCATLTDRLVIATAKKWDPPFGLSEQVLISCGDEMGFNYYYGCEGGIPQFAIEGLNKVGVPIDHPCLECHGEVKKDHKSESRNAGVVNPNVSGCNNGGHAASSIHSWWQNGCDANASCTISSGNSACPCKLIKEKITSVKDYEPETEFDKYRKYKTVGEAHSYTSQGPGAERKTLDLWPEIPQDIIDENIERMKKAIYYEGPITVAYRVTADFFNYWQTITSDNYYKYDGSSAMTGGHAVCIVGWKKTTDGTPVWIIKNSWGENGGYGFPDGATMIDPISEKEVPKYLGGFYNHIMGINDSFIESNSCGAHPDLQVPDIKKLLPNEGKDIPKEYFETMTIRDIYEQHSGSGKSSEAAHISEFNTSTMSPADINLEKVFNFFSDPNNHYIVAANNSDLVHQITSFLPKDVDKLSVEHFSEFIDKLKQNITEYVVVSVRGDMNNYYNIYGNPKDWNNIFHKKYSNRYLSLKRFSGETAENIKGMLLSASVSLISNKNENFTYRVISTF